MTFLLVLLACFVGALATGLFVRSLLQHLEEAPARAAGGELMQADGVALLVYLGFLAGVIIISAALLVRVLA